MAYTYPTHSPFSIPVESLVTRLAKWQHRLGPREIDIGRFPDNRENLIPPLPVLQQHSFRFMKWLYRSNKNDLALVQQPDGTTAVLKIVTQLASHAEEAATDF